MSPGCNQSISEPTAYTSAQRGLIPPAPCSSLSVEGSMIPPFDLRVADPDGILGTSDTRPEDLIDGGKQTF